MPAMRTHERGRSVSRIYRVRRALLGGLASVILAAGPPAAGAAVVSWTSPVSGNWSEGANWSGGMPPGSGDDAVIAVSGPGYRVTLDVDATVRSLTLGNAATPCSLVAEGRSLALGDSSLVKAGGVFALRNFMTTRGLLSLGSSVLLDNLGTVNLRASTVAIGAGSRLANAGGFACARVCSLKGPGEFYNAAAGLVTVSGLGVSGLLVSVNDVTSAGTIELTDTDPSADVPSTLAIPGGRLTVAAGGKLRALAGAGAGDSRALGAELVNHGRLEVDLAGFACTVSRTDADHVSTGVVDVMAGALLVPLSGPTPTFTNSGRVEIRTGTTLMVTGTDPDYRQTAGRTILHGTGVLDAEGDVRICGGTLEGTGDVFGDVVICGGRLAPGASPGRIVIHDGYTQEPDGSLHIELGAFAAGAWDTVVVLGHADLAGSLEVNLLAGISPMAGDSYPVFQFASRSGTFDVFRCEGRSPAGLMDTVFTATAMDIELLSDFASVEPGGGPAAPPGAAIRSFTAHILDDGSGVFELALDAGAHVALSVYDVAGRRVATLLDAPLRAARYRCAFGAPGAAGAALPSGVYFARAEARTPEARETRLARVVLVR